MVPRGLTPATPWRVSDTDAKDRDDVWTQSERNRKSKPRLDGLNHFRKSGHVDIYTSVSLK